MSHWGGIAAALRIKSPEWSNGAWSFASSAKTMLAVRWLASALLAGRPSRRLHPTTSHWFDKLFFDPLTDDELDALGVVLDRMLAAIRRYTAE